jgi:lysophospholipase L1-like esterase
MPIVYSQNDFYDLVEGHTEDGFDLGDPPKYKILVEGDSWVSHPLLRNLCYQLDLLGGDDYGILNLAIPGDTAVNMLSKHRRQLKQIGQLIATKVYGYEFDLIFISAAGNDIVGEEMVGYVDNHGHNGNTGIDLINNSYDQALDKAVKGYENLIKLRDRSTANKTTPIVTHVYSYLRPRKVGTKMFGRMFGNGWVKQYLDPKGIPQADQIKIIREMLDRFNTKLSVLENQYNNFYIVDTLKVLSNASGPNTRWFYDEIHPNNAGFAKVAKEIKKHMVNQGVWLS